MTDEQIEALEVFYTAAYGNDNLPVTLNGTRLLIRAVILDYLVEHEFLRNMGRSRYALTKQGVKQAIENRGKPLAAEQE